MLSDFIDEFNRFLVLTDEEYEQAKVSIPKIEKYGREFLEYGESREGYWTRDIDLWLSWRRLLRLQR